MREFYKSADHQAVDQAIDLLRRLIEQRSDVDPEGYLILGIAYFVKGEYEKSSKEVEKALAQQEDDFFPEAHYYLGRAFLESNGDLHRAISELRQAIEQKPDNDRAYLFLGMALRALAERETLGEAEKMLQKYLERGAPFGLEKEVQEFLNSRRGMQRAMR